MNMNNVKWYKLNQKGFIINENNKIINLLNIKKKNSLKRIILYKWYYSYFNNGLRFNLGYNHSLVKKKIIMNLIYILILN